jgi:hypothetical protein
VNSATVAHVRIAARATTATTVTATVTGVRVRHASTTTDLFNQVNKKARLKTGFFLG